MLIGVLALFALALAAPWLARLAGRAAGPLLALLPGALAVRFATLPPGEAVERYAWLPAQGYDLAFRADGLGLLFAVLVTGIGALVVLYAASYLAGRAEVGRFLGWLLAFMASMLGLVLTDDLIGVYIFWELTSVTSYLLIGFDHDRAEARGAALQALLVTGMGGLALLAGLLLLGEVAGTYSLSAILALAPGTVQGDPLYPAILALVALGAFTKSAQFPFHFWLPNAMQAPTPASAYLHSSTMVKAGVYLLARLGPVLGGTAAWTGLLGTAGALTFVVGAALAVRETHFKRVLAYTTVSALGAMVMLVGLGTPAALTAAATYIVAHALYKAALFLVAGAVDHATGEPDVKRLGGLRRAMPVTAAAAGLAALSMAGAPPLVGFVAKELVLEATLHAPAAAAFTSATFAASVLTVVAAGLVGLRPFWGPLAPTPQAPHEAPWALWSGPALLAGLGLAAGVAPAWMAGPFVGPAVAAMGGGEAPGLALWHGLTPALAYGAAAIAAGVALYALRGGLRRALGPVEAVAGRAPDRGYAGVLRATLALAAAQTRALQSGRLRHYLLIVLLTTLLSAGVTMAASGQPFDLPEGWWRVPPFELGLALLTAVAALATVTLRSRLAAIAAMGVAGYGIATVFLLYGAPDLAMTQLVVETLTVILFVLAFHHLPGFKHLTRLRTRARDAVVATAGGLFMAALALVTGLGYWFVPISGYYESTSLSAAEGRNVVNTILVDYRALDTLGEITVLAAAGLGIRALLRMKLRRPPEEA